MSKIPDVHYLFVYGTLRRDVDHPMAKLLRSASTHVGEARFQGQLYRVSWYPAAIASDAAIDVVIGDVFELNRTGRDVLFEKLDEYEGTTGETGRPPYYRRERHPVTLTDRGAIQAWIYLFNRKTNRLERIESGDFLNP